ncbi:MAG: Type 1 glutamine amidotransferase-like domain-containing protein [Gammaproteobacteria bacterium]
MIEKGQIVAIGGGGFATDPPNFAIDNYLLSLTGIERPHVGFIPTATGDAPRYVARFLAVYGGLDCYTSYLPMFSRTAALDNWVRRQDLIFVGGGNTRSMLAVWREWGLPELLDEALRAGTVLAGQSAGAICWFEQGLTDSRADTLHPLDCLGFLPGSCCPHYDGEPERKPAYRGLIGDGQMRPGLAIDNGAAAHFVDGKLARVLAWREDAGACRVESHAGEAQEQSLETKPLTAFEPDWPVS